MSVFVNNGASLRTQQACAEKYDSNDETSCSPTHALSENITMQATASGTTPHHCELCIQGEYVPDFATGRDLSPNLYSKQAQYNPKLKIHALYNMWMSYVDLAFKDCLDDRVNSVRPNS